MSTATPATRATVLVLNSGSSSLKYQLVDPATGTALAVGLMERIGQDTGLVKHEAGPRVAKRELPIPDHAAALTIALDLFEEVGPSLADANIVAVGHRVVQGGPLFDAPVVVDDAALSKIEGLSPLAPLHNPANATGIAVGRRLLPDVPHVAVFDTGFFHALPAASATYALAKDVAEKFSVRRYGAHGTSHEFVSKAVAELLGRPLEDLNQIVLHLGNGASASAIKGGSPIDTSMGLTPSRGSSWAPGPVTSTRP
ncbi:hypothetical protein GCM10025865_04340 [Paraoerskovia sediminicola]|uniref:Acetate kinase n=1 Tax=Paraoerskovia sediminicola TaxID=1138587 RepID=A0ABN6X948_9CELL|nr:hypothetical protein GCM10025865_04340 [Paraoerskovia sediminicola]